MSYGEPEDVPGECNARLSIADNYGDNHATIRCQLEPGHGGMHTESFRGRRALVMWAEDEREKCEKCGVLGMHYGLCKTCSANFEFSKEAMEKICSDDE